MLDVEKVKEVLDEIRPVLQNDGGDLEFVEIRDENIVVVKLRGACAGCPGARMTLKMGVERHLKSKIPEVGSVEAVNFQ